MLMINLFSPDMNSHKVVIVQEVHPVDSDPPLHGPDDAPGGVHDLIRELEVVPDHVPEHWTHEAEVWVVGAGGQAHPDTGAPTLPALPATGSLAAVISVRGVAC